MFHTRAQALVGDVAPSDRARHGAELDGRERRAATGPHRCSCATAHDRLSAMLKARAKPPSKPCDPFLVEPARKAGRRGERGGVAQAKETGATDAGSRQAPLWPARGARMLTLSEGWEGPALLRGDTIIHM